MKREELEKYWHRTWCGCPHTKHSSVESLIGTVGVGADGVEFDSLDGEPVQLLFLLVSHPVALATTCVLWRISLVNFEMIHFVAFSKQSKVAGDITQLLEEADNNQFASSCQHGLT